MANTKVTTNVIADDAITGAKIADDAINSEHYTDGSIDTAHIADDQVTLAKMAGIARGKIIYGDSSGNPAALAVGSNGQVLKSDGTDIAWGTDSSGVALDDISTGDAATTLATSAGNITIDAQGSDTDIIFKGTDDSTDTTFLTLDGSDAGTATFNHDIILGDNGVIGLGAGNDLQIWHDASNSHINNNTGVLYIDQHQDDGNMIFRNDDGSGGLAEYIVLDGGGHKVNLKKATEIESSLEVEKAGDGNSPILHVIDTADTEVAWFEGNRAGDTGAFIAVRHNPSSQAESNRSGIKFQADDDGGNVTNYATITQYIEDNTNTTEDARIGINVMSDGSNNEVVNIRKDQFIYTGDAGSSFIRVDNRADGHDTGFEIYQNGSRKWEIHSDDSNSDALDFRPAGVQKFTFTQDGELGIGNTNPGGMHSMVNRLVVGSGSGNQGLAIYSGAGSEGSIGFARDIAANTDAYDGLIEYSQADRSFRFGTNGGTERMRLKTGLSIGSATDPGNQNLFVAGAVRVGDNSPSIAGHLTVQGSNAGVPILYAKNTNADSLGIRAEVNANSSNNAIIEAVNSDGAQWKIRNDGDHFGSDTSIGAISDSRLKKDVSDLTYDIAKFKQYRPVEFNWINDELHRSPDSGKTRGFLAQEVKALDDYYVDKYDAEGDDVPLVDSDGKAHTTKFGYKDAMYISVIKQLITRLEAAEAKITALEG